MVILKPPNREFPMKAIVDKYGNPIPWETCLTLNNNWGYYEADKDWKSPELIVHALVNCVSKNGNLLLNVGPDAVAEFRMKVSGS